MAGVRFQVAVKIKAIAPRTDTLRENSDLASLETFSSK
jgi:hypothetical protein